MYTESQQLSIQSAHSFFTSDTASNMSHTKSPEALKPDTNAITIICPAAVVEYLETNLHSSPVESIAGDSRLSSIMAFETLVSKRFSNSRVVCCLFDKFVRSLDFVHLLILVKHHALYIDQNGRVIALRDRDIVNAIKRGMDISSGKGSSTLITKTLEHIHQIRENTIFEDPVKWRNMLMKTCGESTADLILKASADEIRKLIMDEE